MCKQLYSTGIVPLSGGAVVAVIAISAYHHQRCEFESRSWLGVLDTTLCDKVLATGQWFSPGSWNIVESGVKNQTLTLK